jgi:hypothetical protein
MDRPFNLWVSELASSTEILGRNEEKYVVCRDVMMTCEAGKIIKEASAEGDSTLRHGSVNGFTHRIILCSEESESILYAVIALSIGLRK